MSSKKSSRLMTTKGSLEFIFMATAGVNLCWPLEACLYQSYIVFILLWFLHSKLTPTSFLATLDSTTSGPVCPCLAGHRDVNHTFADLINLKKNKKFLNSKIETNKEIKEGSEKISN